MFKHVRDCMMENRREFLKKVAYVAPVVLTLRAVPSFAASGSPRGNNGVRDHGKGVGNGKGQGKGKGKGPGG